MITNITELIELMDDEAEKFDREEDEHKFVTGGGIKKQWDEKTEFPCQIFYMKGEIQNIYATEDARRTKVSFNVLSEWFDEEGNVTERPAE